MSNIYKILPVVGCAVVAIFACVFFVALAGGVQASKGYNVSVPSHTAKPLQITLGKADVVRLSGAVSDVLVADPSVVDVQVVQADRLYIVGTRIGDTNIITLDMNGDVLSRIDIHISYDLQAIQNLVDELFPDETVEIGSIHGQILLTGTVSTPDAATKIANIVGHYVSELQELDDPIDEIISNLLAVRGEQQVMLRVKILEATRSVVKEFGLDANINNPPHFTNAAGFAAAAPGSVTSGHGNSLTLGAGAGLALSQDPTGLGRVLIDSGLSGLGTIGLFLNALEEENLVNILAEPNLTAVSGEQAGFLAGGEFPVPVGRDQIGNLVIEFREFGVSLNFKPIVMSDKRISLQIDTEVSSLDFDNAVTLADIEVPGLDVRRTKTTVELPSGGSLMIGGLLQSEALEGMAGMPGIGDTPVLGALTSSESFRREETELVVIVTCYLVEPYAEDKAAEVVPVEREQPLAIAFAQNIRRVYTLNDDSLFEQDSLFGYLLD